MIQNRCSAGSPPRVRELLLGSFFLDHVGRITPACAGITIMTKPINNMNQDHPRVCGNYAEDDAQIYRALGSPPRVRELPTLTARFPEGVRITPACAGITARC